MTDAPWPQQDTRNTATPRRAGSVSVQERSPGNAPPPAQMGTGHSTGRMLISGCSGWKEAAVRTGSVVAALPIYPERPRFRRRLARPTRHRNSSDELLAEGVGFEPTEACTSPVFKTGALDRSAIPPIARESAHGDSTREESKAIEGHHENASHRACRVRICASTTPRQCGASRTNADRAPSGGALNSAVPARRRPPAHEQRGRRLINQPPKRPRCSGDAGSP